MPKVFVIMNTKVQLNMTAIAEATPLTSDAKSSPIIILQQLYKKARLEFR